jgi:hypothetical protein
MTLTWIEHSQTKSLNLACSTDLGGEGLKEGSV